MEESNSVFKKNYCGYLQKLDKVDFSLGQSVLAIEVDEERKTAQIPFFQTRYQVSQEGVVDNRGKRPDYGICVILLKYLLMCPKKIPPEDDWVAFRELKDSGLTKNGALSDYAMKTISTLYAGNKSRLKAAVRALGGRRPETDYPYDLSAVFTVLPRIPILFLYNDADRQFPAQASILFERRAERFLDPECLVMIGFYLSKHLKRAEK